MANSDVQHESDGDGPGTPQRLDGPVSPRAILLFPPNTTLPGNWLGPWIWAGWTVTNCASTQELAQAVANPLTSGLIASPWPADIGETSSSDAIVNGLQGVIDVLGMRSHDPTAVSTMSGGMARRGDFLAQLAAVASGPEIGCCVLMAIQVDHASELSSRLDMTAIFEIEERISERFAALLGADDAYTIWMELGFGVLIRRDSSNQIVELAERICACVADTSFLIAGEPTGLTVSIGLALHPPGNKAQSADQWFATAHGAQAIAHRHGGNRYDGVITREYEPIPAERVLIIREWVQEAKTGQNVVIEFQPVLPLRAGAGDLYSVHPKLRDYRAPLGGVYRPEYLRIAREGGAMIMIDRMSLFGAFEALEQERARGRGTRLLVPVELATLIGIPWRWLEAELRRRRHLSNGLILELEAHRKLEHPDVMERISTLRYFGVTIGLSDRSGDLKGVATWARLPADVLRLQCQVVDAPPLEAVRDRLAPWRDQGRQMIVDSVQRNSDTERYTALGVDYLRGRDLAEIGPRLDFEFE